MGKVFTHFSKPKARFVREATYGIQASGDTKLSSIVRAIEDYVAPIQTEKRLSRNIEDETVELEISAPILSEGARHVRKDTLILIDPTEQHPDILRLDAGLCETARPRRRIASMPSVAQNTLPEITSPP